MTDKKRILILPGDEIGPEITTDVIKIIDFLNEEKGKKSDLPFEDRFKKLCLGLMDINKDRLEKSLEVLEIISIENVSVTVAPSASEITRLPLSLPELFVGNSTVGVVASISFLWSPSESLSLDQSKSQE